MRFFRAGVIQAGSPQGIAPLELPQIRTCPLGHTARHIVIAYEMARRVDRDRGEANRLAW